ncbi:hypothetical protein [Asticcacaulis sp. YBE204]|uniref:hypothetical protein n=1 Tax=Asticcacaulis sp. YBE204 TaxID=1282363 RepID=UPI0003C3B60F|nr:hypothetical protein [Asticcacaulis sp. YBE204]ESQ80783.1 hypothetical protein AEYBE204_00240 [Asticcacaulis sp. YBE204]
MKWILWTLIIWLCAATAEAKLLDDPVEVLYAMPDAVDHVVEMRISGYLDASDRIVVQRRKEWVGGTYLDRVGLFGARESVLINVKRHEIWRYGRFRSRYGEYRKNDFAYLVYNALRDNDLPTPVRTEGTDKVLGETCAVWRLQRDEMTETFCATQDGIILWYKTQDAYGGSEARATKIKRLTPPVEDMVLPADITLLSTWGEWLPDPKGTQNHETRLRWTQTLPLDQSESWTSTVRHLGGIEVQDRIDATGEITRTYKSRWGAIIVRQDAQGIFELSIDHSVEIEPYASDNPDTEPPQMRLNEPCWRKGWTTEHGGGYECLTRDGARLEFYADSYFPVLEKITAEPLAFRRGHLKPTDVMPPADLLSPDFKRLTPF